MISLGEQLKRERKKQNLTAEKIAEACGTSRSYITLIENDKRLPGKNIIPKIAIALGIKTTTVLNWYLEEVRERIKKGLE